VVITVESGDQCKSHSLLPPKQTHNLFNLKLQKHETRAKRFEIVHLTFFLNQFVLYLLRILIAAIVAQLTNKKKLFFATFILKTRQTHVFGL